MLMNNGDILYVALKGNISSQYISNDTNIGEDFNYSAILDDYLITKELGVGGFGKVMLGKHKEEKKEVAIKFMDVSEQSKHYELSNIFSDIRKYDLRNLQRSRIT